MNPKNNQMTNDKKSNKKVSAIQNGLGLKTAGALAAVATNQELKNKFSSAFGNPNNSPNFIAFTNAFGGKIERIAVQNKNSEVTHRPATW